MFRGNRENSSFLWLDGADCKLWSQNPLDEIGPLRSNVNLRQLHNLILNYSSPPPLAKLLLNLPRGALRSLGRAYK